MSYILVFIWATGLFIEQLAIFHVNSYFSLSALLQVTINRITRKLGTDSKEGRKAFFKKVPSYNKNDDDLFEIHCNPAQGL